MSTCKHETDAFEAKPFAIENELLQIQSDFFKNGFETACGGGDREKPTTGLPLDFVDCQGAVDLVRGCRQNNYPASLAACRT